MNPIYNNIGHSYSSTRRADPFIVQQLADLLGISAEKQFLDLACGTGNYTNELASLGGRWHGVDISSVMLAQASAKNARINWCLAGAHQLPYVSNFFDGVICTLAIHHFFDLPAVFTEVARVLNRGRFIVFTAFPDQMRQYWLYHYFPGMMKKSISQMPEQLVVIQTLQSAGFSIDKLIPFHVTNQLNDLFLYAGKERPEQYLDPRVRANISSFASLCEADELEQGLRLLQEDLSTGRFDQVAERYRSNMGDYVFISAVLR